MCTKVKAEEGKVNSEVPGVTAHGWQPKGPGKEEAGGYKRI